MSISKIFLYQTLCVFSQMTDTKHIRREFLFCGLNHAPGVGLKGTGGAQGVSCLSCVATYLPALCCRGAAVSVVLKPTCLHCAAEVQLFKWCRNLSAGIVLQRCSCLSGVETYLSALCCRGVAV